MKKFLGIGAGVLVVGLTMIFAVVAFSGSSSAQTATPGADVAGAGTQDASVAGKPTVAIAIGQLNEADGGTATVDLRAGIRGGKTGGALRFFSDEHGYYNGGVKTLTIEDGKFTVTGGGGLFLPDGTRKQVRYSAVFSMDSGQAEITVKAKDGFQYTMSGVVDGLVTVRQAPSPAPSATQ
jgi:hypothetical protein